MVKIYQLATVATPVKPAIPAQHKLLFKWQPWQNYYPKSAFIFIKMILGVRQVDNKQASHMTTVSGRF